MSIPRQRRKQLYQFIFCSKAQADFNVNLVIAADKA